MSTRYAGNSEAYKILEREYVEGYAIETLLRRAIPDERDGLKVVQRRTVYKGKTSKIQPNDKSQKMLGMVTTLHPHGDGSIYDAMVRMCDKRGQQNIPLLKGQGSFGIVYSSDKPAAARYTEMWLHDNANDFFTCPKAVDWVEAEIASEGQEPGALNVSYPAILTQVSSGIAVSASSDIPSFNFWDVLDITEKYLKKGVLEPGDEIVPDFPTGANIIFNQKELFKIMKTGIGKFKIRAEIQVRGKEIDILEVPHGFTVEQMRRRIKNLEDIPEIRECEISTGATSDAKLTITCSNAKVVDSVVAKLLAKGILQRNFTSRMVTVFGNSIHVTGGIEGILRRWVPWRQGVIQKHYKEQIRDLEDKTIELGYFIRLVTNEEWRDSYVEKVTRHGSAEGAGYLKEIFDDIPESAITWISERAISSFNNGGKYIKQYEALLNEIEESREYMNDPDKRIMEDFAELRAKHEGEFQRKTHVSMQDYKFEKVTEDEDVVDDSYAMYFIYKDGFVFKTRGETPNKVGSPLVASIVGQANSVIMVLNTAGNIVRVYGEDIKFNTARDTGTHIQGYSGCDDGEVVGAFEVDGSRKAIYYADGWIGFLDTNEFLGQKRKTRLIRNGVCKEIGNVPVTIFDMPEGNYTILGAAQGVNSKGVEETWLGVKNSENIVPKSRTSRTRLFVPKEDMLANEFLIIDEGDRSDFWDCGESVIPISEGMFEENMRKVPMFWDGFQRWGEAFQPVLG